MENPVNKFKCVAILLTFLIAGNVSILMANDVPSVLKKGQEAAQKATVTLGEARRLADEAAKKASEQTAQELLSKMQKGATAVSDAADKVSDSRFKRVLKISGCVAAGLAPVVGGALCYRYDVYGIGTLIGSYGSWWQSFRNWLGIRRLEQGQASMQETLTGHGQQLEQVIATQGQHGEQLSTLGEGVAGIRITQTEHGDRLNGLAAGQQRLKEGQEGFRKDAETQFAQLHDRLAPTATQTGVNSRFDQLESAVSDAHAQTGQRLDSMRGQLSDVQLRLGYLCNVVQAAQLVRKTGTPGVPHLPVVGFPGGLSSNPSFGRGRGGIRIPRITYLGPS